jgi:hypothetical protein
MVTLHDAGDGESGAIFPSFILDTTVVPKSRQGNAKGAPVTRRARCLGLMLADYSMIFDTTPATP